MQRNKLFIILSTAIVIFPACRTTGQPEEPQTIFLSPDGFVATNLLWSPSGDKLSITTFNGQSGEGNIFIWDMLSEEAQLLYSGSDISADSWSPTNDLIALTTLSGIVLLDLATLNPLSNFLLPGQQPAWSPKESSKIAYYDYSTFNPAGISRFNLMIYDTVSNETETILQVNSSLTPDLVWSQDGEKLATVLCSTSCNIYLIDGLTDELTQLTESSDGTDNFDPSWSPDGNYIAYLRLPPSGIEPRAFIRDIQRACETELKPVRGAWSLEWSSSGEHIAFTSKNNREVHLLNLVDMFGNDFMSQLHCNE